MLHDLTPFGQCLLLGANAHLKQRLSSWYRRVFGEVVGRDEAAVFRLEPTAPVGRGEVLQMLVTGGSPGGASMPQCIVTILVPGSGSASSLSD
jgi:hypothetical protein